MNWQEKQCELEQKICDSNTSNVARYYRGIFLSSVMNDGESARKLIHDQVFYANDMLKVFYDYYYHKDKVRAVNEIEKIHDECSERGFMAKGFYTSFSEPKYIHDYTQVGWSDKDETNWMDLKRYDKPHTLTVSHFMGRESRHFENATVIGVLEDVVKQRDNRYNSDRETGNQDLDLMVKNISSDEYDVNLAAYTKMLKLLNAELTDCFDGKKAINDGHCDAVVLADMRSGLVYDKIDYAMQHGFHQSELGEEMLKFSYLTSFSKTESGQEDMDAYINGVKNAGHWRAAIKMVSNEIAKRSLKENGINQSLMMLSEIKPMPNGCEAARGYHKRDADNLARGVFYLGR